MWRRLGLAFLSLSVALAGCVGDGAAKAADSPGGPTGAAPPATASGDKGSITGSVIDDEQMPVSGARVGLLDSAIPAAVTDASGTYTINDVEPGTYTIVAERLGYDSTGQKVSVAAGEVATINFVLVAIAVSTPRTLSYQADGFIEFAFVVPTCCVFYFNNTGQTIAVVVYKIAPDTETAVMGLTWSTSAPFTGRYVRTNAWLCKPATTCTQVNFTRSFSPLLIRTDNLQETINGKTGYHVGAQFYPTACDPITNAQFCATNPDTIMTVTAQQRYRFYTTVFMAEPAPEGYSPFPN